MKKKVLIATGAVILGMIIAFWIVFDVGSWKKLDMDKLRSFSQSTLILDGQDRQAAIISGSGKRTVVSLDKIPTKVQQAFVAAEDARFYEHHGVDLYRIGGALLQNLKAGDYAQGASTITQQLIKLTHLTNEKTISRKLQEAFLAIQLERKASKKEILEMYLNAVYFGNGAYGIESAAQAYFGISASELTLGQGALLAGVLKSPSRYAPHLNLENAIDRRKIVLAAMVENDFISQAEADQANEEEVRLKANEDDKEYAWYVDQTISEACSALQIDSEELLAGGYMIYTSLNTDMQKSAQALFNSASYFPENAPDGEKAQAAMIAINSQNGEVLSLIGGRSYEVQRGLNRATGIRRQPGSAFKPISVYAAAIDFFGMLPSSLVDDTQRSFGNYSPHNSGDRYYGVVSLRDALSKSLNVASVDLLHKTDVGTARTYAERAGIVLSDQDQNLSFALGSLTNGVSPMELCGAYAPLSNGGYRVTPHLIRKILDSDGQIVYEFTQTKSQVMKVESAYMLTDMLKTAAKTGSAKALAGLDFDVAGKTGTVGFGEIGNRDAWMAAYTPKVCVTAWMGFDNPDETHKLANNESGSSKPARLIAAFLKDNKTFVDGGEFSMPATLSRALIDHEGLITLGRAVLPSAYTPKSYTVSEVFPLSQIPTEICSLWEKPTSVYNLSVSLDSSMHPRISFSAVQSDALYQVYRIQDGEETLVAELSGQPGDVLEYVDLTEGDDLKYYVRPVNGKLLQEGVHLEGDPSEAITVAKRNSLFDWIEFGAEPTSTPMPIKDEMPLF